MSEPEGKPKPPAGGRGRPKLTVVSAPPDVESRLNDLPAPPPRTARAAAAAESVPSPAPRAAAAKPKAAAKKKPKKKSKAKSKKKQPQAVIRVRAWIAAPVIATLMSAWFFQPWSEYSPAEMAGAMYPGNRLELLRSFDDLFPHRVIAPREDAVPLDRQEAPLDAAYDWSEGRKLVETFLEEANVTGLFVIRDGVIVHERYRLGATEDTRFTTFSLAGGVVASLIGAAVREGRIASLDDTVETYAPLYLGTDYGSASIRDLLAQTSGMAFDENYRAFGSDILQLYTQVFLLGGDPDRLVSRLVHERPPGEAVDIASPNTQVLAAVVSAVYDAPLASVVEEKIWRPFGMTSPASWSQNRDGRIGAALGFCCWNATLQDIGRFGEVLRRGGAWGEERLLPEAWMDAATTPSAPYAEPGAGGDVGFSDLGPSDLGPWGYGLHFYVPAEADGEFLLSGEFGQYLWVDRANNTVVAMTAADPDWLTRREEATAVLRSIVATASAQ